MEELPKIAHDLKNVERTCDVKFKGKIPFNKMLLGDALRKGIERAGYIYPTIIQANAIPLGKAGIDLIIQSKSGTGKTVIFCTVLLELYQKDIPDPQSLILVPTREIAVQIEDILNKLGKYIQGFKCVAVIGGFEVTADRKRLQGAKSIVGTPGRVLHLIKNQMLNISNINLLVLDEADKMMTRTFRQDFEKIQSSLSEKKQVIACSATFCKDLDVQMTNFMKKPLLISTDQRATMLIGIKQFVYELPEQKTSILEMQSKITALKKIFERVSFKQCLAFAGSQSRADSYRNALLKDEWPCEIISGAQDQKQRLLIFRKFLEFKTRILIATDLMSRGIDSENLNLVINFELPDDGATYLHRIGRGGRFGSYGIAVTLVSSIKERNKFSKILASIDPTMKVLKFPLDIKNYDIWNFENYEDEIIKLGSFMDNSVENIHENVPNYVTDEKENCNAIEIPTNGINSKTFKIDVKKVNTTKLPLKETLNSIQLLTSSNTIDDASSLAVDSDILHMQSATCSNEIVASKQHQPISLLEALIDKSRSTIAINLFDDYKKNIEEESVTKCSAPLINTKMDLKALLLDSNHPSKIIDLFSEYEEMNDDLKNSQLMQSVAIALDDSPVDKLMPNLANKIPKSEDNSLEIQSVENPHFPSPRNVEEEHFQVFPIIPDAILDIEEDIDSDRGTENSVVTPGEVSSSGFDERTSSERSSGVVSSSMNEDVEQELRSENGSTLSTDSPSLYSEESTADSSVDESSVDTESRNNAIVPDSHIFYQDGYAAWTSLYRNQMAQIQEYVKFCAYVKQNP